MGDVMKKGLIVLFLFLLFSYFKVSVLAVDSIFVWEKTEINVEYGQDIQSAIRVIKESIKLKDGYDDERFYVLNDGINYTFQSVINTNVLKTYKLDHKAVSPKYKKEEIRTIYFHIVDLEPPKVISSTPFIFALGDEKPNYLSGFIYSDNTTDKRDIVVEVNERNIDYQNIGDYQVVYKLIDQSGNYTYHIQTVSVVDLIKPVINLTGVTKYNINQEFNLFDYIIVTDNYDENVNVSYEIFGNINELGEITIKVLAVDSSLNSSTKEFSLQVVDEIAPKLILEHESITINTEVLNLDLLALVSYEDNYDSFDLIELTISENILFQVPGVYEVYFTIIDTSGNCDTKTLEVIIIDDTAPVIFANDLIVKIGMHVDLFADVVVTDNFTESQNIELSIYSTNFNNQNSGIYFVTYQAIDEAGNHSYKTIHITVQGLKDNQISYIILAAVFVVGAGGVGLFIFMKKRKNAY